MQTDRKAAVRFLLSQKDVSSNVDLDLIGIKTEGYVFRDLVTLVDYALFETYKNGKWFVGYRNNYYIFDNLFRRVSGIHGKLC